MVYEIDYYKTKDGKKPFKIWLNELSNHDLQSWQKIVTRLKRLALGNLGHCDPVGEGVHELKIHFGQGFRVYFAVVGKNLILILCANTKRRQQKDIDKAKEYFDNFKTEKKHDKKK